MFIFSKLVDLYESRGYRIRSSISPFILNSVTLLPPKDLSFTYIFRQGKLASHWGGGIHLTEVLLLQQLGMALPRKRILVIGNSFGWSTFALALANPGAKVVAVDACLAPLTQQGLDLTNRIAREERLNVHAFKGKSPEAVPAIISREFSEPIDLAFIDGWHDDDHQYADFTVSRRASSPDCVYLLHDVIGCRMLNSFLALKEAYTDLTSVLLSRTESGMGMILPNARVEELKDLVKAFSDNYVTLYRDPNDKNAKISVDMPSQIADVQSFE